MKRKTIYFATGNKHKFVEVVDILRNYPVTVELIDAKGKEIQSDSIIEIAEESATNAALGTRLAVFVEDTGLFIQHLQGFPGPYAAYIYRTIGLQGILTIMKDVPSRDAFFRSVVAFASPSLRAVSFVGEVQGRINSVPRGTAGFGYDPIFEPYDGGGRTFGEMNLSQKNQLSHRASAVKKFADWYVLQQ